MLLLRDKYNLKCDLVVPFDMQREVTRSGVVIVYVPASETWCFNPRLDNHWTDTFATCVGAPYINYVPRANAERLNLIQGDTDTFADIIGLIGEYEGTL